MKPLECHKTRMRGMSLVELMVAMTIGLIILAAISSIFVTSRQTYTTQDRMARLQENARFAMQFLIKDLRLAGFYGCLDNIDPNTVNNTLNNDTAFAYNALLPIEGLENATGTWSPSGATTLPSGIESGTDAVVIRMADTSTAANISGSMPNESAELDVSSTSGFAEDDIIMVSDCANADIMQVTQVQDTALKIQHNPGGSTPGNETQKLSKSYAPPTKVFKFITRRYFVKRKANGIPSLYRQDNAGAEQELVEGIENLQILYGKDTDTPPDDTPNLYLKAGDAGLTTTDDWSGVKSVRIGLLAVTVNDKDTDIDTGSYDVDGDGAADLTLVASDNDRNKRRIFQVVVQLRNML